MGTEAKSSYLLTAVAGGFAVTFARNETQQHSAALKIAGQNPVVLLPLFHARLPWRHSTLFQFDRRLYLSYRRIPPCDFAWVFGTNPETNSQTISKPRARSFIFVPGTKTGWFQRPKHPNTGAGPTNSRFGNRGAR